MAGLDLVATSSPAPTATSVDDTPVLGVGSADGPPASGEPEAEAPPSSGGAVEGEFAAPPTTGEPALVQSTAGEDDIAPPVLGVPSSSEDEEELIADPVGAPMVGAPHVVGETADVGVQTAHNVVIPAFDLVDVAAQTDGKVAFSSFVGDTPQAALATAIRALSPGSLFRLDGALRQALAQPLVDVAPSLQGGGETSPAPPDLDLLGDTPGEHPASSGGVVDPGPGPASARIFWEEQNATAVAEQAAMRPLPDDDFDPPATALEAYLKDQDVAAGTTTSPASSSEPVVAIASAETSQTPAPEDTAPGPKAGPNDAMAQHLRRQAFIRQEQMARSLAGMRLLHDGATYAQALESRIEREIEEQRQAEEAAALAKAKPKGPPAHLVGTEARPPFGVVAAGSQAAPEVTPTAPAALRLSGGAPEVTTPAPGSGTLPTSPPTRQSSRPTPSTAASMPASSSTSTPGTSSTTGPDPGLSGVFPPPKSTFPPVDRPGRAGYGTRNQSRRRGRSEQRLGHISVPTSSSGRRPSRHGGAPHRPHTWEEAERLEAAIAAGADIPPQCVSAGVVLRSLPPTAQGGRLPQHPPPGNLTWFGWCFVRCPGSYRRDGTVCPDGARCLRPVNYPPLFGRPHEHHECARCSPPSPRQRFAD